MFGNNEKPSTPDASIILVSYNNLRATTVPCLESIFEKTSGNFEVICVDNCSTDGTPEYLNATALKEPRLKPILNKENRGFAGGNNIGIQMARGKYIVLLNNDTMVTEGWLEGLTSVLEVDETVGLVGPVSNAVGNEQRIDTVGQTLTEVLKEGERWCAMSKGSTFETDMLCFFCVAMRRDVINKIGLLDEAYGLGFYEDDDYCIRIRKAGHRLVCAEYVFVYHSGGGSFSNSKLTKKLLKRNKKLLEEKLQETYNPRHWRDKLLDIMKSDIKIARETDFTPGLRYRIENRMHLIKKNKPRNLLKKLVFNYRVQKLENAIGRVSVLKPGARQ